MTITKHVWGTSRPSSSVRPVLTSQERSEVEVWHGGIYWSFISTHFAECPAVIYVNNRSDGDEEDWLRSHSLSCHIVITAGTGASDTGANFELTAM